MVQLPTLLHDGLSVQLAEATYCASVTTPRNTIDTLNQCAALVVASFVFAASLFQVLYVCRKEHRFRIREFARVIAREDVVVLAFLWAANVLTAVRNTRRRAGLPYSMLTCAKCRLCNSSAVILPVSLAPEHTRTMMLIASTSGFSTFVSAASPHPFSDRLY